MKGKKKWHFAAYLAALLLGGMVSGLDQGALADLLVGAVDVLAPVVE